MANPLDTDPSLQLVTLIEFSYGNPVVVDRYVNWPEDLTIESNIFTALPGIRLKFGRMHGGTKAEEHEIMMRKLSPFGENSTLTPRAKITAHIRQMKLGDETTLRTRIYGTVEDLLENLEGKPDLVRLKIGGMKRSLDIPLGLQCNTTCTHIFAQAGEENCNYDLTAQPARVQTGVMTVVQGSTVNVAGLVSTVNINGSFTSMHSKLFFRGTVSYQGLEIDIRDYTGDGTPTNDETVILDYPPPASWEGQVVTVTMGCNRSKEDCFDRNNLVQFQGCGFGMPDHNPQFEIGS